MLSVICNSIPHSSARWAIVSLLVIALVLLGAAAKRSQFPSANPATSYLCKAVKMAEVRFHETGAAVLVPSPSPQSCLSMPVRNYAMPADLRIDKKTLRIELQSPPLLV